MNIVVCLCTSIKCAFIYDHRALVVSYDYLREVEFPELQSILLEEQYTLYMEHLQTQQNSWTEVHHRQNDQFDLEGMSKDFVWIARVLELGIGFFKFILLNLIQSMFMRKRFCWKKNFHSSDLNIQEEITLKLS